MITFDKVFESLVLYAIIHSIIWCLLHIEKLVAVTFKSERNRILYNHVKHGHESKARHCRQDDCMQISAIDSMTI